MMMMEGCEQITCKLTDLQFGKRCLEIPFSFENLPGESIPKGCQSNGVELNRTKTLVSEPDLLFTEFGW